METIVAIIISAILAVIAGVFGTKYKKIKNFAVTIVKAIEDNKVDSDEVRQIIVQARNLFKL